MRTPRQMLLRQGPNKKESGEDMNAPILAPAAALCVWSLVILVWMLVTRFPAMGKLGLTPSKIPRGSRGHTLEGRVPDDVTWKAHNYAHLMEQPTIFYPVVIILALTSATTLDVNLAWAYVGIRIVHSVWQSTVNIVAVRGALFGLSSLILMILAVRALLAAL